MQAAEVILSRRGRASSVPSEKAREILSNWLTRLFGCWHAEMSRPFTLDGESYRTCLDCGAHRKFDPARWEMVGAYYYRTPRLN